MGRGAHRSWRQGNPSEVIGGRSCGRPLPLIALVLAAALAPTGCQTSKRPSLVMIVVDTLRSDHLGCYGYERDTSPAIDALAADAVRFDRAYSTSSWTKPAVATILTGFHPGTHGVGSARTAMPDDILTLAELLKGYGYATGATISYMLVGSRFNFQQGFDVFLESESQGVGHISTDGVTRQAISLLHRFRDEGRPFFLFVHYFDPHYDYQHHAEYGFAGPGAGRLRGGEPIHALRDLVDSLTAEEIGFLKALYDEEIRYTDAGIGRVIEALRELGLYEETLIVLTADHGEEFLEHGWIGHTRTLYEEIVHVPLVMRVPGDQRGARVVGTPVSLASLVATIADLLGLGSARNPLQGPSLGRLLRGDAGPSSPTVFFEVDFNPVQQEYATTKTAHKKGLLRGNFKLILDEPTGDVELYELSKDGPEGRDVSEENPELVRNLLDVLSRHVSLSRAGAWSMEKVELSEEQIQMLRELGYGEP